MKLCKNPILLDKATLQPVRTLAPASLSVSISAEDISEASMVLTDDAVKVGEWVRVFSPQGDAGVFVVRSVSLNAMEKTWSVELDHALCLLNDCLLFGEVEPNGMGGTSKKCTADQAARFALSKQDVWSWSGSSIDTSQGWTFRDCTVWSALQSIVQCMNGWAWKLDTSALPFTIGVVERPTEASCEMRISRNLSSITQTVELQGMATRVYPVGFNGLTIDGDFLEKNVDVYGLTEKIERDDTIKDKDLLRQFGEARLEVLSEPVVNVSISGLDLSAATGEPMDTLTVGTVCRIPLPEYGTSIKERIVTVTWEDCLADPESVTVEMANNRETASSIIKQVKGGGGGTAAAVAATAKNMWTEFERTDEHIRLAAKAVDDLQTRTSELKVTADAITSTVNKYNYNSAGDMLESWHSNIKQTSEKIELTVTKTQLNEMGERVTAAESSITQLADNIELKVSADEVVSSINMSPEEITIKASKINLSGYAKVSQLEAATASIDNLLTGTTVASHLHASLVTAASLVVGGKRYVERPIATLDGIQLKVLSSL